MASARLYDVMDAEVALDPPPVARSASDRAVVLEQLFRAHYAALVGLAGLLLDQREQSEEVVQEAFARAWVAWPRVRGDDPLPYVRKAVVNLARGGLRRRIVARRHSPMPPAPTRSSEDHALEHERRDAVAAAIATLSRRQRECVVLHYYADCTVADTASTLAISVGSVKQHLQRGREHLAVALDDEAEAT